MFPKMKLLVVILLKLFPTIFCTILTKDINHQVVYSVVDGSANLPCNINPPLGTKGKKYFNFIKLKPNLFEDQHLAEYEFVTLNFGGEIA